MHILELVLQELQRLAVVLIRSSLCFCAQGFHYSLSGLGLSPLSTRILCYSLGLSEQMYKMRK